MYQLNLQYNTRMYRHLPLDRGLAVLLRCRDTVSQGQSNALRFASYPYMTSDVSSFSSLDTQVGQRVLAYRTSLRRRIHCSRHKEYTPNKLRAYMFADKKSQSPDSAPSGVRQDMFVTFITCERYSRGSL